MSADLDALLAQVYANPSDRAPRAVYADALQATGDPRGEFIALQLQDGHDNARARALLDAHWQAWLGPLAACVDRHMIYFMDGFLELVILRRVPQSADVSAIGSLPIWSTVRTLIVMPDGANPPFDDIARIIATAPLPRLDKLSAHHRVLSALSASRLCTKDLVVMVPDDVSLGDELRDVDFALARDGTVTIQRAGVNSGDLADIASWQRAATAGCEQLDINVAVWPPDDVLAAIVDALANERPRPPRVAIGLCMHVVALEGNTLAIAGRNEADARLGPYLATFSSVLPRFATIRLGIGWPFERTVFEGDSGAAIAWLQQNAS